MSIVFTFDLTCPAFYGLGEMHVFRWLKACLVSVTPIAQTFVAREKVWVTFNLIFQILAQSQTIVFLVLCEQAGNRLRGNASHVQIHGQNPLTGAPTHTHSF